MSDTLTATPARRPRRSYATPASPERAALIQKASKLGYRSCGHYSLAKLRALVAAGPPPRERERGQMYPEMRAVYEYLNDRGPVTCFRISRDLELEYPTAYDCLSRLELRDLVEREREYDSRSMKWRRV